MKPFLAFVDVILEEIPRSLPSMRDIQHQISLIPGLVLSRPRSRSDPIGESEPVSGCETIYWDSLFLFFFRAELISVVHK